MVVQENTPDEHGEDANLQGAQQSRHGQADVQGPHDDRQGRRQIDLYYFGPGHTNGDAWVVFPAYRIVHSGDIFAGQIVPLIDTANGGSMRQISETLNKAHNGIKDVDTIINGHTPSQTSWADLKEFAEFNRTRGMDGGGAEGREDARSLRPSGRCLRIQGLSSSVSQLMGGMAGRIQALQKGAVVGPR